MIIEFLLVAGACVVLGAIVQSGVGLGLGLVAAPVVTLLFPWSMPGALLIGNAVLPLLVLTRDARDADWPGLTWAMGGRLVGTPLGVLAVALVPERAISLAVGGMVLAAIAVTLWHGRVPRNRSTLAAAGLLAGGMGTATSISGPPMALLYQREKGPRVRATLSVFFTLGAAASVVMLAAAGRFPVRQLWSGLALTPFMVLGFALSGPLRRYLDSGRTRAGVLVVTGLSAGVLIVRNLFG